MVKKGFLKTTGCILISASIILTGWTFVGSSISEADNETEETTTEETTTEDSTEKTSTEETTTEEATTEETTETTDDSEEKTETKDEDSYTLSVSSLLSSLSTSLLSTSSTTDTSTDVKYDGTTLTEVPPSYGSSLTVKDGTTAIAAGALSDSNITSLTFADGSDITSIGDQGDWPANGTKVYCPNDKYSECGVIVSYFTGLITSTRNIQVIFGNDSTSDEYTITITEVYGDNTDTLKYTQDDYSVGETISPTSHSGYTCSDSYKVTSDETQSHTFTYTASSSDDDTTYTVTVTEKASDGSFSEVKTYTGQAAGTVIQPTTHSGYTCSDTYTVTTDSTQTATFTYTASGSSDSTTYTVTVTEVASDNSFNEKLTYSGKAAGTVIYPTTRSGYTCSDKYTVTTAATQTVTFTYKPSGTNYTVTVYDEFYTGSLNNLTERKTRSTNTYASGSTYNYSPATYSGYTYAGCRNESGTVTGNTDVYFFYLKNGTNAGATPTKNSTGDINTKLSNIYQITGGANQNVLFQADGTVTITCNGELSKFTGVFVDNGRVDSKYYTLQSGSTILTFTKDFMKLWSVGTHVVRFEYTDGYAETNLTVSEGKSTTKVTYKVSADGSISTGHTKDTTPKTADGFDSRYLLCLAIFLLGAGAFMMGNQRKLETILANIHEE